MDGLVRVDVMRERGGKVLEIHLSPCSKNSTAGSETPAPEMTDGIPLKRADDRLLTGMGKLHRQE